MAKKSQLKIPPQNLDAEQAVLGSLLIDKNAIFKVADVLTARDFYSPAHEKIYEMIIFENTNVHTIRSMRAKNGIPTFQDSVP